MTLRKYLTGKPGNVYELREMALQDKTLLPVHVDFNITPKLDGDPYFGRVHYSFATSDVLMRRRHVTGDAENIFTRLVEKSARNLAVLRFKSRIELKVTRTVNSKNYGRELVPVEVESLDPVTLQPILPSYAPLARRG